MDVTVSLSDETCRRAERLARLTGRDLPTVLADTLVMSLSLLESIGGDSTGRQKTAREELGENVDLDGGGLSGIPDVKDIQDPRGHGPGAGNIV